MAGSDDKFIS